MALKSRGYRLMSVALFFLTAICEENVGVEQKGIKWNFFSAVNG